MIRDLSKISRDLEDKHNSDIILKKNILMKTFTEDPDLFEILGRPDPKPLNHFVDWENPTDAEKKERAEILDYNSKITHKQIVPILKLNGIQKEVLNFIMFEINDRDIMYANNRKIKKQILTVMCLVHEDDVYTEYGIMRPDLLSYIVKDLLDNSNVLGMQLNCVRDIGDIVDFKYYCRTLQFEMHVPKYTGNAGNNRYDYFNN